MNTPSEPIVTKSSLGEFSTIVLDGNMVETALFDENDNVVKTWRSRRRSVEDIHYEHIAAIKQELATEASVSKMMQELEELE